LLLGRQICAAGLKSCFNSYTLSFKIGKKTIIKATINNSLYIVLYIADRYQETVFLGTEVYTLALDTEVLYTLAKSELKASKKERYLLYYRHFAHLGLAKIAKLYKVTTL
jgi:hypothetical protein